MKTQKATKQQTSNEKPGAVPIGSGAVLGIAAQILQGLLASGHYTIPGEGKQSPDVWREDAGKDGWKGTFAKRFYSSAVMDSIELADELIKQIEIDYRAAAMPNTALGHKPAEQK